jgi:hypothetical protein
MKIKVTAKIEESINSFKNKTARESALQVYAALYSKRRYTVTDGYFPVPATYLKSYNSRYAFYIRKFISDGIIKYFERVEQGIGDMPDKTFKSYDTTKGECMRYKFLVDIDQGKEIEIQSTSYVDSQWYKLTKSSLIEMEYDPIKIKRDGFGLRVWHNATHTYKKDLKNKNLVVIDAKCSQPRLLYNLMKEAGQTDVTYFDLFENTDAIDFYDFLITHFNITHSDYDTNRKKSKKLFTQWIFGKGYTGKYNFYELFPVASAFVATLKKNGYKKAASFMQRKESKIWIDDIMNNIEVDFAIPIHDSIIVKADDADLALGWCIEQHPEIVFTMKEL